MSRRQIDQFFRILSQELDQEMVCILTGAAAGSLLGEVRPSMDIDFAVRFPKQDSLSWEKLEKAVDRAVRLTGLQADYAEDIDRWGLITLLDYKNHTRYYRRYGYLKVFLLEPEYWSIGKMTRYLDPDIRDMIRVFKKQKTNATRLVSIWAKALKASPPSAALSQFRKQVEDFLKTYGLLIWGRNFDADEAIRLFRKKAGVRL